MSPGTPATCWGPWTLDRDVLALELVVDGHCLYEVDLERCPSAAAVLDWVAQIAGKQWATPEIVGHLVAALCDLLEPQARLCGRSMNERDPGPTEQLRERIVAAEVQVRAHRLARLRSNDQRIAMSLAQITDAHNATVADVRRELGLSR